MSTILHNEKILILDFGSQYSQLIARRVREIGVYCEILPWNIDDERINEFDPNGIILSGGPETVLAKAPPRAPEIVFSFGCPVLGICYGMQAMAAQLGGEVESADHSEFGHASVKVVSDSILLNKFSDLNVWMSHGDHVTKLPDGFKIIASTQSAPIAAMEDQKRNFYGLQFHPEVTHTAKGVKILSRFVLDICKCGPKWTVNEIIASNIEKIKNDVGGERVILGLSGGVDSSVAAVLLHEAIGDQLTCVFVDTGLMRLNEVDEVKETFAKHMGVNLVCIDAQEKFYDALRGVVGPEQKRKIVGNLFIDIFAEKAKSMKGINWFAQGTIYPDVIESAAASPEISHIIKTHHNVGGLPEKMPFKLIEPLRELFKDEVRKVGLKLGLPHEMIYRHPFPGPGLAVRVLGEIKEEYVNILRHADNIFIEELRAHNYYNSISQAFAVFLPVKSVGVMGDARKYDYVICLRAVETVDFMTASWAKLSHDFLAIVSNRIINEVKGVSRVAYDISSKPPATIEWE